MGTNRQTEACNVPGASGYKKLVRCAGNVLLWLAREMNYAPQKLPNARTGARSRPHADVVLNSLRPLAAAMSKARPFRSAWC
jgi:hypothetical protein